MPKYPDAAQMDYGIWGILKCRLQKRNVNSVIVEQPFSGLYTMSSNANLTEVTLTFKIFEENLAGNYCCSKESKKEPTCQCIQKAEPLTPKPVPHTEASTGTEVARTQATSTGAQLGLAKFIKVLTTGLPFLVHQLWMEIAD
ncbi:hypothetical protein DPMN_139070 [Dreissena polymorpha]|uniref:CD47 immunoglobulin-like domain-containing protein n=1 Tax=Dreissena polymorpha TaxID=45954 RepID=A0A9D4G8T7_DREPO|nr:hypothetical protein DPMN_139070 [Dreissena polymorpha]